MKKICLLILLFAAFQAGAQPYPSSYTDGKYVMVNGARLWVVLVGHGDPLVIIPGGPGEAHIGYRSFDSLAKDNEIVYFDAFGRGKSDTATDVRQYTLARDIDDIEGLRKALHFEKWNVLGHSYGGVVAQGYALKYPSHVSHLILANTFHSYLMWQANDDNSNHEIKTNYPEVWDSLMMIRNAGAVSSDPEHMRLYSEVPYGFLYAYNPNNFLKQGAKPYPHVFNSKLYYQMVGRDGDFVVGSDIGSFDYRKELKNLRMPVLIYGGRYDRVAIPAMMIKFKTYCPQAEFVMFEKSGHNPQVEQPDKLFPIIEKFLHD
ncbi:MAG: alpha/beta fold hydrolase [Bacteroidota bacterium]|nr:alpha/beta fold hydrolase [Bacteroidota bacterium]